MSRNEKRVLVTSFVLLVLVSIWGSLPSLYCAPYRSVGPDDVSVYEPESSLAPFVPVKKIHDFSDTGKKVAVSIRNRYRDEKAEQLARITLTILVAGFIAYRLAGGKRNLSYEERAEPVVTAQRLDGVRFEFRVASSAWLTSDRSAEKP